MNNEQTVNESNLTLSNELQDHLNNIALTSDRIESLIYELSRRMTGGAIASDTISAPTTDDCSVVVLNSQALGLAINLNDLGDKLAYLVKRL